MSFASDALAVFSGHPERTAEVFAKNGRLLVDGAPIDFSYAYALRRNADESAPSAVRIVDRGLRTLLDVSLPSSSAAGELVAALDVGAMTKPIQLTVGAAPRDPFNVFMLGIVGVLVAACFTLLESWLFFAVLAVEGIAYALVRRSTRELVLDETGMSIRGFMGSKSLDWAEVVDVERAFDDGIRVALASVVRGGDRPAFADPDANKAGFLDVRSRDPVDVRGLRVDQRDALFALVKDQRRRAKARPDGKRPAAAAGPEDLASPLALGGRDEDQWFDALARQVPREGYRDVYFSDETLRSLARDVDQDASSRLAAAIVLRRRGVVPPRVHLDPGVDPTLRSSMDEALTALEADPGAREPVVAFARHWSRRAAG